MLYVRYIGEKRDSSYSQFPVWCWKTFDVEKTKYNEIITNQQTISIASENNGMLIWDIVYGKTVGHFIGVKLHDKVEQTQA